MVVQLYRHNKCCECHSLIAVYKRVIAQETPRQGCCYSSYTGFAGVVMQMLRTRNGGFKAIFISDTLQPTVALNQPCVDGAQCIGSYESKTHLASSR